jgi:hypothetical protein
MPPRTPNKHPSRSVRAASCLRCRSLVEVREAEDLDQVVTTPHYADRERYRKALASADEGRGEEPPPARQWFGPFEPGEHDCWPDEAEEIRFAWIEANPGHEWPPRSCRRCGCTDDNACGISEGEILGCYWVEWDLCSACAPARVIEGAPR